MNNLQDIIEAASELLITEYPWLVEDGIQDWYAGITPLTNEEIDKLGRGLSDD